MALRAGQEVDAYCTKCKMDLTHRIVAVVDGKPVKVECRTCYQTHVYRLPKSASAAAVAERATSTASSRSASASKPATSRRASADEHAAVVPPSSARVHSYRITERFIADQWIVHKTFGNGLVVREIPPDKIEVRFDSGVRTLIHNRTE